MKVLVVITCLVAWASANSFIEKNAEFEAFKHKFGRTYRNASEEEFRLKIFLNNLKAIADHNKLHKEGKVFFSLGVNQFADLTTKEFAEMHNTIPRQSSYMLKNVFMGSTNDTVPDSIDWRDSGCVGGVKDQGQCGGVWAFCTVETIEDQQCIATGVLVPLSVQNLLDCSWDYGNEGCNGGWVDQAFEYCIDNGIDTEASYPYEGRIGLCHYSAANVGVVCKDYYAIRSGDENALKVAVGTLGPVNANIDASHASFQLYNGGVYYEPACSEVILDQCVTVVGYGNEDGEDYWLVKNSWGTTWGENGYIKMARNRDNNCGIATQASYAIV